MSNVYLMPEAVRQYQEQLADYIERELYIEAKQLLEFLLSCSGEAARYQEEWMHLYNWVEMAVPDLGELDEEQVMRELALAQGSDDQRFVEQVMYIMMNHPVLEQRILAVQRAAHLQSTALNERIVEWLEAEHLHPELKFHALQTLCKRGYEGTISLMRLDEDVELEIEQTPLRDSDYPLAIHDVLERAQLHMEEEDPTLVPLIKEFWTQVIQRIYGTSLYELLRTNDAVIVDCFAAALHVHLEFAMYGYTSEEDVRSAYGIHDHQRFRYEQIVRQFRKFI